MDGFEGRIVVLPPGTLADAVIVEPDASGHTKPGVDLVAGHDLFLFVADGEGTYVANGRPGILRPNTLVSAPAGSFACDLRGNREIYVLAVRQDAGGADAPPLFTPFFERQLPAAEGRFWRERMADYATRAAAGSFGADDVADVKRTLFPYLWRREGMGARYTLERLFASITARLTEHLSLQGLAAELGYSANYLNDLTREHTGQALGRWITGMRMARARATLEGTDLPVADVGAHCGYDDPAYFSRAFRRTHGVPPATWRIASRPIDERYGDLTITLNDLREYEEQLQGLRSYSFAS